MSDEPRGPFIWQSCELPPSSSEAQMFYREVPPPTGYMLHSWRISPIGELVICWVRMRTDLASQMALALFDATSGKKGSGE